MSILDRYFQLSDVAGKDQTAFRDLMSLFSDRAELHPASGDSLIGQTAIKQFFAEFFKRNTVMKHVWKTTYTELDIQTVWAVAGQRANGDIFALSGVDFAQLDENGKIQHLEIYVNN